MKTDVSQERLETWRAREQVDLHEGILQGTRVVCVAKRKSTPYVPKEKG